MGYRSDDLKRPSYVPRKQQDFLVIKPNKIKKGSPKNDQV